MYALFKGGKQVGKAHYYYLGCIVFNAMQGIISNYFKNNEDGSISYEITEGYTIEEVKE